MYESAFYRKQLLEFSASFRARAGRQIWRDDSLSKAEWMFFVGFFVVRKLIENRKVTDAGRRMSVAVKHAPINRTRVVSDFMRHDLEKDVETAQWCAKEIDVAQFADKVIHAWWTSILVNARGGHGGYIFTTDRDKDAFLWRITSTDIARIFSKFANSEIRSLRAKRDEQGKLIYWEAK